MSDVTDTDTTATDTTEATRGGQQATGSAGPITVGGLTAEQHQVLRSGGRVEQLIELNRQGQRYVGGVSYALVQAEPESPSARALLAEIQMELGDYEGARASFGWLGRFEDDLAVAPRVARWEEVQGLTLQARNRLYAARAKAASRGDLPNEQVAWFHLRVGDLELRNGRLRQAERAFREGLAVEPGDHRLYAGLARVEAARGRFVPPQAVDAARLPAFAYGLQIDPRRYLEMMRAFALHLGTEERPGTVQDVKWWLGSTLGAVRKALADVAPKVSARAGTAYISAVSMKLTPCASAWSSWAWASASPVCSPARASLLTGQIPSQHGVHDWLAEGNMPAHVPVVRVSGRAALVLTADEDLERCGTGLLSELAAARVHVHLRADITPVEGDSGEARQERRARRQ